MLLSPALQSFRRVILLMIIGVFHLDPICYYTMLELNSSEEVLMELIVVYTNAQVI
jgi:hypothetical protein